MASDNARRAGFVLAAIHFTLAGGILAVGWSINTRLDVAEANRKAFAVQVLREQPMSFTRCWKSGDDTIRVSTEQGVNPPGAPIVPEDGGDLSEETVTQAEARHAARCAAVLAIKPKTGDC